MKYFTGIGSRETPKDVLDIMRKICKKMVLNGWTLRSGGADGADEYCAYGWGDAYSEDHTVPIAEIYLPWEGFNGLYSTSHNCIWVNDTKMQTNAHKILERIHPAYDKLTRGPLALHTRNCYQVLGSTLSVPSKTVLAYAKTDHEGNPQGGTATAINLAKKFNIPIRNLYIEEDIQAVLKYLEE